MTDTTTPPATVDENGVPLQRKGRRCGWEGKDRYDFGATRLRTALTDLARDEDPAARVTGMRISDEVADLLHDFATRASNATSKARRAKATAEQLGKKLDQLMQNPRKGTR
ncbi:hypothetical protein [Actinomadura geliboluensis]|uniref:hypothetical protein n=1 Tax=Actinomadura geliboluensis TaxID=882440 RepID=UPI003721A478